VIEIIPVVSKSLDPSFALPRRLRGPNHTGTDF
jgi:hypothetical protein